MNVKKFISAIVRRRKVLWLLLTVVCATLIAVLTLLDPGRLPKFGHGVDKVYHAIAFAALVIPSSVMRPRQLRWVVPIAFVYGAVIELVQPLNARSSDVNDLFADAVGIMLGVVLGLIFRRVLKHWADSASAE